MAKPLTLNGILGATENSDHAEGARPRGFSTISLRRAAPVMSLAVAGIVGWHLPALLLADRTEIDKPPTQAVIATPQTKPEIRPIPPAVPTQSSEQVVVIPPSYESVAPAANDAPTAGNFAARSNGNNNPGGKPASIGASAPKTRLQPQPHTRAPPPAVHVAPHSAPVAPRVVVVGPPQATMHPQFYAGPPMIGPHPYGMPPTGRFGGGFGGFGGFHGGGRR